MSHTWSRHQTFNRLILLGLQKCLVKTVTPNNFPPSFYIRLLISLSVCYKTSQDLAQKMHIYLAEEVNHEKTDNGYCYFCCAISFPSAGYENVFGRMLDL